MKDLSWQTLQRSISKMIKNDRSWTEINLDNFVSNLNELKHFIPENVSFMQIVKADAYGHGAFEIAKLALECGAVNLGVANVQEAVLLRYRGITAPILILSPAHSSEIADILENNLTVSISNLAFAISLSEESTKQGVVTPVHLNIDTGMGRSGFRLDEAIRAYDEVSKLNGISIEGIFSHFVSAESDVNYTRDQQNRFRAYIQDLPNKPRWIHLANSSGSIVMDHLQENLVRFGLLSFGVYASESQKKLLQLKPVMSFKTKISQIKSVKRNESVGYNRAHIASQDSRYAILPVGYADGYDFQLSQKGLVSISKTLCPVIGRISMDMTAVDLVNNPDAEVGDEVLLIGDDDNLHVEELASLYNGSAYELLCQVGRRAKRYYIKNGETISSSPLLRREFVSSDYNDEKLSGVIETAIEQRLHSKEIAGLIYKDVLEHFFREKDRKISYRSNFEHTLNLLPFQSIDAISKQKNELLNQNYFRIETSLKFRKIISSSQFLVVCANNEDSLKKYFNHDDTEYRWLLDENLEISDKYFKLTSVRINEIELQQKSIINNGCLEIHCSAPELDNLINQEVEFNISTLTWYPKNLHQLAVYINQPTKGVSITLNHNGLLQGLEGIPIFSGRSKFPLMEKLDQGLRISSKKEDWVFPTSGVVFAY